MMRLLTFLGTIVLLQVPLQLSAQPAQSSFGRSFAIETGGAVAGSLIGAAVGIAALHTSCDSEDLACDLTRAGVAIGLATVGSATGAVVAGRAANTDPSIAGAILGALAGGAAGLGVVHLLTEELSVGHGNRTFTIAAFSLTQGIVTALGSRLLSSR